MRYYPQNYKTDEKNELDIDLNIMVTLPSDIKIKVKPIYIDSYLAGK